MDYIVSQFPNPMFAYKLFQFFFVASILIFVLGLTLVWRNAVALRFMNIMSIWISTRKLMKPAAMPHFVEPVLLKRPVLLGAVAVLVATVSTFVLIGVEPEMIRRMLFDGFSTKSGGMLAEATRTLLLVGNAFGMVVGGLLIFAPRIFSSIETYADKWFSLRKASYPLEKMHTPLDSWVSANPTVSGIVLIVVALGMGITMYVRMTGVAPLL